MIKKKLIKVLGIFTAIAIAIPTFAYAANNKDSQDIALGYSGEFQDISIGASSEITMRGTIEPTIMSVTLPSYIPFSIGNIREEENKVISPRIKVKNNSNVPVKVKVGYTSVNLYNIPNVTWSNNQNVGRNGIAIGFKKEITTNQMPNDLSGTKWLSANSWQNVDILSIDASTSEAMYVVGTLGSRVSEQYSSFTVTPTLVVSRVYD